MTKKELGEIYDEHSDTVYHYLLRLSRSEEVAFDLMQDTFLRAYRYHSAAVRNMRSWLLQTAHNVFLAYHPKRKREQALTSDEAANLPDSQNLATDVEWADLRENIMRVLANENGDFPAVFVLRVELDLTQKEIAKTTKIPYRTVRRHLEKIRQVIFERFKTELNLLFLDNNPEDKGSD